MGSAAVGLAIIAAGLIWLQALVERLGGFELPTVPGRLYSCLISPASISRRLKRRASAPPLQA